jgi:hypothetical protein
MSWSPYTVVVIFALLVGFTYTRMSTDKKRFGLPATLIGSRLVVGAQRPGPGWDQVWDPSWEFEEEPIAETPGGVDDPEVEIVVSTARADVNFFEGQINYNQEHSHDLTLKGTIHANLIEICGVAINIVREPFMQLENRDEIESSVRRVDRFMQTYMKTKFEEDPGGRDEELFTSYHEIWERLEQIGVIAERI